MARQERPVDPAAGPLQAFAYDLRKLRAEAGNPTYRALAKVAGYSATTLSEAAGGARMPSLEVVLAYVGACRGDLDDWRRRWYRTTAELTPPGGVPEETTEAMPPVSTVEPLSAPEPLSAVRVAEPVPPSVSMVEPVCAAEPVSSPTPVVEPVSSPTPVVEPVSSAVSGVVEPAGPVPLGAVSGRLPPAGTGTATGAGGRPRRRRTIAVGVAVAATLLIVVAAAKMPSTMPPKEDTAFETPSGVGTSATGVPGCPSVPSEVVFTGVTYGSGAHVRDGATRDNAILGTIPPDCTVGFTGYCIGEKVYDNTAGTPDVRWFKVAGGGVLASAIVHGNPPRTLPASECPNARPAPSRLAFSIAPDRARRGAVTLHATGIELDVVGFAVSTGADPAAPGARAWRQLDLVDVRDLAAGARLGLDAVPTPSAGGPVVLVAAACLGGDSPTGMIEARQLRTADPGRSGPVALNPQQRFAAAASACRYPDRG